MRMMWSPVSGSRTSEILAKPRMLTFWISLPRSRPSRMRSCMAALVRRWPAEMRRRAA